MPDEATVEERSEFFSAKDGVRLFRRALVPETPRAAVLVLHGYADHGGRYLAVMRHLAARGFAAFALDYRGHGQAAGQRGHVDSFAQYHADLGQFLEAVTSETSGLKRFVLAHSHGALITLSYALAYPDAPIAGVVLSNPYLKLAFAPPAALAMVSRLLSVTLPSLAVKNHLHAEMLTRDAAVQRATEQDPLYGHTTTARWFIESNRAQTEVTLRPLEFRWPALVLLGNADPVALPETTRRFFANCGSPDKQLLTYDGFRHEILNEIGREHVYADIERWLVARIS
jgi:lysophospholipase